MLKLQIKFIFYKYNFNTKVTFKPLWIAYTYCICLLIIIFYTLNKMTSFRQQSIVVAKMSSAFVNYVISLKIYV